MHWISVTWPGTGVDPSKLGFSWSNSREVVVARVWRLAMKILLGALELKISGPELIQFLE